MPANRRLATVVVALAFGPGLAGCWREERAFRPAPSTAEALRWTSLSELHPGLPRLTGPQAEAVAPAGHAANAYEENAYAISEGKRFYTAYNCNGCHAHGGGDIGPPLLDDKWIYGHEPEQVFSTIVEGRPNGMPAFGGRVPAYQVWWLVAYVRSMSGLADKTAAPGRDDHMKSNPPENSKDPETPASSSTPRSAEMPQ